MTPPDDTPWFQLSRQFAGLATAAELDVITQWLAVDPRRAEFVSALRAAWEASGELPRTHDSAPAWERVRSRIAIGDAGAPLEANSPAPRVTSAPALTLPATRARSAWRGRTVRAAAAIVLLAGGASLALAASRGWFSREAPISEAAVVAFHETSTGRAQRATMRLADGTRVTLSVGTTLRYPPTFSATAGATRDVYLDGEAFFDVAHDSAHPFLVHTGNTVTRVLGTRFAVRGYSGDASVTAAVEEGRVALGSAQLTKGKVGRATSNDDAQVLDGARLADYVSWVDGRLEFHDTPLRDVLLRLSRWYDLDVRLGPGAASLASRRFTGAFKDQAPSEVFAFLALAADVHVSRRGRTVTITAKQGSTP